MARRSAQKLVSGYYGMTKSLVQKPSQPRIWVTRTASGAEDTANALRQAGFDPVIAPLLEIGPATDRVTPPKDGTLLIFTSRNGVDHFCLRDERRDCPVVTVGDKTAAIARDHGFDDVVSARGTWHDIVDLITRTIPTNISIMHCSGQHVRGEITQSLREKGYEARREIYYRSYPVTQLPDLNIQSLSAVLLHSQLAAQTLRHFAPPTEQMAAISMSSATDAALGDLAFKARHIAKAPDEASMLKILQTCSLHA